MRLLPFLLAACAADAPDRGAALDARRAALGLEPGPLPLAAAMERLEPHEAFLREVFARGRRGAAVLDRALEIENLLRRADFGAEMAPLGATAAGTATDLARAAAEDADTAGAAGALLRSCLDCHDRFREPR